ncbi:hypothetical protein [Streptomyces specialis]|uniref:hypothetical protein n=1 Tax=Streptomyces specialis TaxID=498367 RepID=UPI00131DF3D7|nr:hypothetical protein [Streptomyces specialis]
MPDPRKIDGYPRQAWSGDERAYVEHLVAHRHAAEQPEPREDDPQTVRLLFELLTAQRRIAAGLTELITALREAAGRPDPRTGR